MDRKIIQISAYTNSLGEGVFALCDDGTLWRLSPMFGWERVNEIPQDEQGEQDEQPHAKELIVCAAVKFIKRDQKDINLNRQGSEVIIPMVRHYSPDGREVLEVMQPYSEDIELKEIEQGFITNFSRFVSREEALAIAKANNQIKRYSGGVNANVLYSEDLY